MKKKILLLVAFLLGSYVNADDIDCSCGNYVDGQYDFKVSISSEEQGCCTGTVYEEAYFTTFYQDEDLSWRVDTFTVITGNTAQRACCFEG